MTEAGEVTGYGDDAMEMIPLVYWPFELQAQAIDIYTVYDGAQACADMYRCYHVGRSYILSY